MCNCRREGEREGGGREGERILASLPKPKMRCLIYVVLPGRLLAVNLSGPFC